MKKFKFKNKDRQKLNLKEVVKSKKFKSGTYSFAVSVIVILIVVAINMIVNSLPSTATKIDVTDQQLTKVSQQTEDLVSAIDKDITLYFVAQEGKEDDTISQLLNRYDSLSSHIKIVKKDPAVNPTFSQNYTTDKVSENSVIVECGSRNKVIDYNDIYKTSVDYSSNNYATEFDGEGQLTSAIDYVTSDNLPVIYTLSGHGETQLSTKFTSAIESSNFNIESLSLVSKERVPDECDCILIIGPTSDISSEEAKKISDYMEAGGNVFITSLYTDGTEFTNLNSILTKYGIVQQQGLVIESDSNYYASPYPYYLLPKLGENTITDPLSENNKRVLVAVAQGFNASADLGDSLSYTSLLTTTSNAYIKKINSNTSSFEKDDGDISGAFDVGALIKSTDNDVESSLIYVSSSYIFDDKINEAVAGANEDFVINSLGLMCNHESAISIHSKSMDVNYLTLSAAQINIWSLILVIALPAIILVSGLIIWVRRRHL